MKFAILSVAMAMVASADCQTNDTWAPAGPGEVRGPCPMLNTLANHGFLQRDGKNITKENAVNALNSALNFNRTFSESFFRHGLKSNLEPNATSFTLEMLQKHNLLEHDASLSRQDAFFGSNFAFDQATFDLTKAFWTNETLTTTQVSNSMLSRQLLMKSFNPTYVFTAESQQVTFGEMSAPFLVFGDKVAGTVNREQVIFWIENEKLPYELGFVRKAEELTGADVSSVSKMIAAGINTVTDENGVPAAPSAEKRNIKMRSDIGFGHGFFNL